ncbi:MAG: hypothetical protein Q9M14_01470, partial [Mariprofundaceae bacterium]|nr:hypothetical protein [Mariprofundaceae bacterium]
AVILIIGFFILMGMACFFIGKTYLILNKDTITRESFPLPFGNKKFYTHKVKRFYAKEKISTRKGYSDDEFANKSAKGSKTVSYEMIFLLYSGKEIPVLKLHEKEQAKYIEQEVENHLKLEQAEEGLG